MSLPFEQPQQQPFSRINKELFQKEIVLCLQSRMIGVLENMRKLGF